MQISQYIFLDENYIEKVFIQNDIKSEISFNK
jgi:hypothetical protein